MMSSFAMAALWFGAAISMAEIVTGGLIAPLGWLQGTVVIIVGHLVGAILFFAAGRLSWRSGQPALQSATPAFGKPGSYFFAGLNLIQLLGWTAVMVLVGADSMNRLIVQLGGLDSVLLWRISLGALIVVWALFGFRSDGIINKSAVALLALLCIAAACILFGTSGHTLDSPITPVAAISFGAALELAVIMPLSWLPLVGDYTRPSLANKRSYLVAAIAYGVGSSLVYLLGMGLQIQLGNPDPTAAIGTLIGIGGAVVGLGILVLSTVTTALLDVHSAGICAKILAPKIPATWAGAACAVAGTILAISFPFDQYQNFLYLIGSVFAPLFAVIFAHAAVSRRWPALPLFAQTLVASISWALGLALYYVLLQNGTPFGVSIPVMVATAAIYLIFRKGLSIWKRTPISTVA